MRAHLHIISACLVFLGTASHTAPGSAVFHFLIEPSALATEPLTPSVVSCLQHKLFATLKTKKFQISPEQFNKRLAKIEVEILALKNRYGLAVNFLNSPRITGLQRAVHDQEELQSLVNYAMAKAPPLFEIISKAVAINQKLNPLHKIAAIDDRIVSGYPFTLIKMDHEVNEKGVHYITPENLHKYELTIRNGRLYSSDGKLFNTAANDPGIYIMDGEGRIYAAEKGLEGVFHHSSFLSGSPVAAAGQFEVRDGQIIKLDDRSGHYLPPRFMTEQLVAWLKQHGITLNRSQLFFVAPVETAPTLHRK